MFCLARSESGAPAAPWPEVSGRISPRLTACRAFGDADGQGDFTGLDAEVGTLPCCGGAARCPEAATPVALGVGLLVTWLAAELDPLVAPEVPVPVGGVLSVDDGDGEVGLVEGEVGLVEGDVGLVDGDDGVVDGDVGGLTVAGGDEVLAR